MVKHGVEAVSQDENQTVREELDGSALERQVNVAEACRRAMKDAKNYAEGARRLLEEMRRDAALYNAVVGHMAYDAALKAIHATMAAERRQIWQAVQRNAKPGIASEGVEALAAANLERIFDYRLPNGLRLGDARRPEVRSARERAAKYAETYRRTQYWLLEIEACLDDDQKTVRESLTLNDIIRINEQYNRMHVVEIVDTDVLP